MPKTSVIRVVEQVITSTPSACSKVMELSAARTMLLPAYFHGSGVNDAGIVRFRCIALIAILLAILHAALAITAVGEKSATFDEPTHLTAGYSYWLRNDFRLDPENGNLPARWAALPLLLTRANLPDSAAWKQGDIGGLSQEFFYASGNDPDRIVIMGRTMMAVFGTGLCLLIFFYSNQLFGAVGGLIAELVAVFDPNLLAHSALITADVPAAFFFIAATWSYFHLLRSTTLQRFIVAGLSLSGLFLAKMSAPAFFIMAAAMGAIQILSRQPFHIQVGQVDRVVRAKIGKAAVALVLTTALLLTVTLAIWSFYSFRFSPFTQNEQARQLWNVRWQACLSDHTPLENTIAFVRAHRLLPEAYLYGFALTHKGAMFRPSFLDGKWSGTGFPSFFPRAFLYKTPIPLLLLLVAAGVAAYLQRRSWPSGAKRCDFIRHKLARLSWIWTLVIVYSAMALSSHLNIGHRHLLPIYPPLFIACGACAYFFRQRVSVLAKVLVILAIGWQVAESSLLRPNYLAYFNEIAGGPGGGYRHLVDSSLDWGQDLPALKDWLDAHSDLTAGRVYLAYFGTARPITYEINAVPLPFPPADYRLTRLEPGLYCISATTLQQVYSNQPGPWAQEYEIAFQAALARVPHYDKLDPKDRLTQTVFFERLRFARLCAYLRKQQPLANIGYSILIFHLSDRDLQDALYGPPPGPGANT